jgi:hypothetical protein
MLFVKLLEILMLFVKLLEVRMLFVKLLKVLMLFVKLLEVLMLFVKLLEVFGERFFFAILPFVVGGTWWRSWLRHCTTSRKVAGSIPEGVIGIFH